MNVQECDAREAKYLFNCQVQKSHYIIFIAMAKCVHVPGKANQKNGLVESMKSITIIIVSHKKKYAQYFPVDLLASM